MKETETLEQPAIRRGGQENDGSAPQGGLAGRSDQALRILIVEDDPVDLMAVHRMIGAGPRMFAEWDNASSLAEALAALDEQSPDVVLTELDLPDSSGLDTVRRLMAHSASPACIVVTDCRSDKIEGQAIALGVQDYLVKADVNARSLNLALRHAIERRRSECLLHESDAKFRAIFESSRDAIMILDRRGFLECNQATLDAFGCSCRDQFILRHPSELSPPRQPDGQDSAEAARERIEAAFATGSQFFEWLHQRIDGTVFPAEVQLSRVELNGTHVLQALVRDISERRRFEEDRTRLVHDLNERVKELDCLYGMARLVEQSGITLEGILNGAAHLVASAWQYPEITCARIVFGNREFRTGVFQETGWRQSATIKVSGKEAGCVEVGYLEERPESCEGPFLREERALLEAVAERLGRIIERQEAQEVVQIAATEWATTFDAITDLISVHDKDLRLTKVNKAFTDAFGKTQEELVGRHCYEVVHGSKEPWPDCPCRRVTETRQAHTVEFLDEHLGLYLQVLASPILDRDGNVAGFVHLTKNITERKQAEQRQTRLVDRLERANQELRDFAHIVSHDLKAPLRGIATLANWVVNDCSDKLDEEGKVNLQTIQEKARKMSDLIDGVLRYSRACSGEETHTDEDLKAVVEEAIAVLAMPASIDVAIETPLPAIRCDKTRMGQVFQNLLGNAAKYMDKSPGRIGVGCREAEDLWEIYVTDNGPGIDKAYHEIIFKMFKTAPNHKEQESTGVGLAIVEKIVKGMGGRIWVESVPGEGSTFLFTLPKARPA